MNTTPVQQEKQKLAWADNLRVFATICVIILHVASNVAQAYPMIGPSRSWHFWNVIDSSIRFTVPVFVMLTGTLLLPNNYSLGVFIRRRFLRIVMPFLFWSAIYFTIHISDHSSNTSTFWWAVDQVQSGVAYHMWYIYMIIGVLLFLPVINAWLKNCTENEILYFLAIWAAVMLMDQPIFNVYRIKIDWQYFTGFMGYLVLGYYLSVKQFNTRHILKIATTLFLLGVGITAVGAYKLTVLDGRLNEQFYKNLTPNVLMASIGIFLFFKNSSFKMHLGFLSSVKNGINRHSYGIYLVHVLVLEFLNKYGINAFYMKPIIGVPLTCLLCLAISYFLVYLVNKLPFGKYISG